MLIPPSPQPRVQRSVAQAVAQAKPAERLETANRLEAVDRLAAAEAAWLAAEEAPASVPAAPRRRSMLGRLASGVRPFVPALVGVTALGYLAARHRHGRALRL